MITDSDRLAVRTLLDSYSDAVITRDLGRWSACWAGDAIWRFRGGEVHGRDAIVATWERAMTGFESVWFTAFPGTIAVDGDRASVRTHTLEHLVPAGASPKLQAGIYEDRLVRAVDGWVFAERTFQSRELPL